jgi:hypothetical protein
MQNTKQSSVLDVVNTDYYLGITDPALLAGVIDYSICIFPSSENLPIFH